jgi:hypothetical protein
MLALLLAANASRPANERRELWQTHTLAVVRIANWRFADEAMSCREPA